MLANCTCQLTFKVIVYSLMVAVYLAETCCRLRMLGIHVVFERVDFCFNLLHGYVGVFILD
jgi:hypothetical protein